DGAEIPSKGSRTNTLVPWRRSLRGPAPAIVTSCGERRGRCPGLSCFGPFGAAEKRDFKTPIDPLSSRHIPLLLPPGSLEVPLEQPVEKEPRELGVVVDLLVELEVGIDQLLDLVIGNVV